MRNLLSAGFVRLRHSKAFYLSVAAVFTQAVFTMLDLSRQAMANSDLPYYLEQQYFDTAAFSGIFIAVFMGLFFSVEYSDGTLRNKLMVGHTRAAVYLSNLVVCAAVSVVFTASWAVGGMAGIPVLGFWTIGADQLLMAAVVSVLSAITISAIFLLVSMLSTNKAITAVACLLLSLGLILTASYLYNNLCQPEMTSHVMITLEDGLTFGDPTPNPNYVAEPLRTVYAIIVNILPTGQQMLLANIKSGENFAVYPVQIAGSLLLIALTTGVGIGLFQRKDLK